MTPNVRIYIEIKPRHIPELRTKLEQWGPWAAAHFALDNAERAKVEVDGE